MKGEPFLTKVLNRNGRRLYSLSTIIIREDLILEFPFIQLKVLLTPSILIGFNKHYSEGQAVLAPVHFHAFNAASA